jgi:hypothetical protein
MDQCCIGIEQFIYLCPVPIAILVVNINYSVNITPRIRKNFHRVRDCHLLKDILVIN